MDREHDLAALFSRITRQLIAEEAPILAKHDVSMWEYSVLYCLARRDAETQTALASAIGYDKTRLIRVLDALQDRDLIERRPDSTDRRAHIVRLTKAGTRRFTAVQSDIRRMEERALSQLSSSESSALRSTLNRLAREAALEA